MWLTRVIYLCLVYEAAKVEVFPSIIIYYRHKFQVNLGESQLKKSLRY